MVRLPVPGPRDLLKIADRGYDAIEKAIALVPRVTDLLGEAEQIVRRVNTFIDELETTRDRADAVVTRVEGVIDQAEQVVDSTRTVVGQAAEIVQSTKTVVDEAQSVVKSTETVVGQASDIVRTTAVVVDQAEAIVVHTDSVVGGAEQLLGRGGGLLGEFEPTLTALLPILNKLAETTDPDEVEALVRLIDTLPTLVGALQSDILPILHTLGTVAPDVRDLLDTTKEFNEILGSLPGLGRIKKRVEERQEHQDGQRRAVEDPPESADTLA